MDRRTDRGAGTRQAIIAAAARLFAEQGYQAVSIEAVQLACAISRGALYHHFSGKDALFVAVLETAEARVAEMVVAGAKGIADPLLALRAGCLAWLRLAAEDQAVRQIVLTDAPTVIGWEKWREMDGRYSLGLLRAALAWAAEEGRLDAAGVELHAHVLLAMLIELALLIARADDPDAVIAQGEAIIGQILGALLA